MGHSGNSYKGNIIYFGGGRKYNKTLKIRECFNDILVFSPKDNSL